MRAMGGYIAEELQADVLSAAVEGGAIGCACDEWGMENIAASKEIMNPSSAEEGGHDGLGIGDAIAFRELRGFLCFADVFAIGVVEGHLR